MQSQSIVFDSCAESTEFNDDINTGVTNGVSKHAPAFDTNCLLSWLKLHNVLTFPVEDRMKRKLQNIFNVV